MEKRAYICGSKTSDFRFSFPRKSSSSRGPPPGRWNTLRPPARPASGAGPATEAELVTVRFKHAAVLTAAAQREAQESRRSSLFL